ncbi:MAG: sensor histidine kinase [Bacteroidales bacterium]
MNVVSAEATEDDIPVPPPSRTISLRRGIAFRLLVYILLFSSAVTLVSTAVQLLLDYQRDVEAIEIRLDEVRTSSLGSLAGSLWHMDADQLRLQLEGMMRLPDMQALEVREVYSGVAEPLVVGVGQRSEHAVIAREFPITYVDRGVSRTIGTLYVEVTLAQVYHRLYVTALVILVSQGVKTFLVSLFTLFIVWRLVTRHLVDIAGFLDAYDVRRPAAAMRLGRRGRKGEDELDRVVAAFNGMCISLERAYADLRDANMELERDIEARKAAEAEITRLNAVLEQRVRQRTAELEAANKELSSFSYSVSHDLRAPLRRIEGFARILLDECGEALNDRGHHCIARIQAGIREMSDMVDSFLRMSRSTRGELSLEPVDLSALAETIAADQAEKEPGRDVAVHIQTGLSAQGDRRLLRAALINLFDNAWKYTRKTEGAEMWFGRTEVEGRAAYYVRDNGVGFDQAFAARLFVPFNRLHKDEDFEGSGIGLATVQRIIARHGGRVWAEGTPGQGSTILFTLWEGEGA